MAARSFQGSTKTRTIPKQNHPHRNLPDQATQLATIEKEQNKPKRHQAGGVSLCLTRRLATSRTDGMSARPQIQA